MGAVTIGLLSLAPVLPSQAANQATDPPTAVADRGQRTAYVSGFVLNQLGQPQDNVNVEVFRVGETETPVASQLTYASVYGDDEPADHGFYNIELRFDPSLGNEFVVSFSSLPDAETQFRPYTHPKTFVARGDYAFLDLNDVRMKLVDKVDSTTDGAVHLVKRGKRTKNPTSEIPAGAKAVLPVTVVAGEPGIKRVAGKVVFTVTQGRNDQAVEFEVKKGKRSKKVGRLVQDLSPVKRQLGVSATTIALPELAGSTASTKKVCEKKRGKRSCTKKKTWSRSETYTLHVSYSGSDEAEKSRDSMELTVLAPRKRSRSVAPNHRPNAWL